MPKYVALFRGVNVGGKNKIAMKELVRLAGEIGFSDVKTYIQSGNVVFESLREKADAFSSLMGEAIERVHGFCPRILVLGVDALEKALLSNPFPQVETEPKSVHFFFLEEEPVHADLSEMERIKSSTEAFELIERVFYLYAPEGIGRSKLAAKAEKLLGVDATARNGNTVFQIIKMSRKND